MSDKKKNNHKCIIKTSTKIRESLYARFAELALSYSDIIDDALEKGRKIDKASLSRYLAPVEKNLKGVQVDGGLSQENILWLAIRYGIKISLQVVPEPYEKEIAIERVKKIFG